MDSKAFQAAINFVLSQEGGYVNDPRDPGGETNFGISKRTYPNVDIKNLTRNKAEKIYYEDYWLKLGCGELPAPVATITFGSAVNCGRGRAAKWLQKALRQLGKDITVDGDVGPWTLHAANEADCTDLCLLLVRERILHYTKLGRRQPQYLRGWLNRVAELLKLVTTIN